MQPNFCNGEKLTVYRFPSEVTEAEIEKIGLEFAEK